MLDKDELSMIFEAKKAKGKTFCFKISLRILKKLKRIRRILKNGADFSRCKAEGDVIRLWLVENFAKLEQTVKNDVSVLVRMGKLLGGTVGVPLFFECFLELTRKGEELSEQYIDEVFEVCNSCGDGLDIKNGVSLLYLLRLSVCEKLCTCFESAYVNDCSQSNILCQIENMFVTLDNLLGFDEERVLKNNRVEKILMRDPCGLYDRLTVETKAGYRKNLSVLAAKKRVSERVFAEKLIDKCLKSKGDDKHIGKFLCDKPRGGGLYLFVLAFLTILFTLLLCLISPVFILCVISVYGCTKLILDKFHTRFFLKKFRLCEIDLESVPSGHGVMVVVTTLLSGDEREEDFFSNLEKMYYSNGGENVYFGILCDLCDSDAEKNDRDETVMENAAKKILSLRKKYGDRFFFFVRKREYSRTQGKYMAPERKRGAVMALTEFLCGKSDRFSCGSIKPGEKICQNIKYVLTLDSDTNLSFGSLKRMVGIMMHPCNKPQVDEEKAVVTKGYGILQPAVNPTVDSSHKTFFASIMCGHGGVHGYGTARVDAAMSLFGQSIFCGKGMFEKECFYKTLCGKNAFKENEILSHDAPEGARLRCAYVPDITLTDSFPSEELAYFKRQHRWIRGDIQNIPFLLPKVETVSGEKIKNNISTAARFFIWHNIYSALLPVLTVMILALSLLFPDSIGKLLVTAAMSVYILPFVYSVFSLAKHRIWQNMRRVFYSAGVYTGLWTEFMRMLFRIVALVKSAAVSLDAVSRSLIRLLISGKNLLEWTTSAQNDAEKKDGLLGYVRKNLISALFGTAFFVISDNGFVKLVGLVWLFLPVFAYFSGKRRPKSKKHLSESQRTTLVAYSRDMWKFFSENVTSLTNHLPTDNVSVYPDRKMARMTSPTNIGLYLVSAVCARKLGFIDSRELDKRLYNTLSAVDGLETYNGMLYNWYDVFTAKAMKPKFISSVDLGNYAASLICVKGALSDFKDELPRFCEIYDLCSRLLENSNPSFLYDKTRKLFYIGATNEDGALVYDRNRYDMLMSEARILSFVSTAKGWADEKHYSSLARSFVQADGYMGLSSWSGTAFEFFMPGIFIPSKKGSLVYEAEKFAYNRIRKNGVRSKEGYVFGISESCYNEFDSAANYKYLAFGVPEIALRVFKKQNVISAYSSFLCLPVSVNQVLSNLEILRKMGAYGEYGFYESVDFERHSKDEEFSLVRCFMSHHIGMSIASCTNALCEGTVTEWFLRDKHIWSALDLNDEAVPYDAYVKRIPRRFYGAFENMEETEKVYKLVPCICSRLSLGNICVYAKRSRLEIKTHGDILASRKNCFASSLGSFSVCVDIDSERFWFDRRCSLSSGGGRIRFSKEITLNTGDKFEMSLFVTVENNTCDAVRIKTSLKRFSGEADKKIVFSISFYPLLDTKENSRVCSFFDESDIVLHSQSDERQVYFRRNSRGICFFAGTVRGNRQTATVKDELICLEAQPVRTQREYEAEFAICFSGSKKCAEMGLVRCSESSFDTVCKILCDRTEKDKISVKTQNQKGRIKDVKGYSMVKEMRKVSLPIDSGEKPLYLLSGKRMSALLSEKGLGMSFGNDINKRRITYFSGVKNSGKSGERVIFENSDGFDLCRNAKTVTRLEYAVKYEGEYRGYFYSVTAFVSGNLPCKYVIVSTAYPFGIRFEATPDEGLDGKRYVGSGIVCFEKRDSQNTEKGFLLGFSDLPDGKRIGAEYDVSKDLCAFFEVPKSEENETFQYVFCVGLAPEREIYGIFTKLFAEKKPIIEEAQSFCDEIKFDESKIPVEIRNVLTEYFELPNDLVCHRSFVKTEVPLYVFDTLLLVYTKSDYAKKRLEELSDKKIVDFLPGILLSLAVSEYIRVSGDSEFAEKERDGETLYRRCLSYLLCDRQEGIYDSLYSVCLESFACLCETFGDVRTAAVLREKREGLGGRKKGGIFL